MRIKDLALKIMDKRVTPYLKFDTLIAKHRFFMCIFNERDVFNKQELGIHIIDGDVSKVAQIMRSFQIEALDNLIQKIEAVSSGSDVDLIKFLLYHEEHHWLHFLDSGLSPKEYCESLDVRDYDGVLVKLGQEIRNASPNEKSKLKEQFIMEFRSNAYEKAADAYALAKLEAGD